MFKLRVFTMNRILTCFFASLFITAINTTYTANGQIHQNQTTQPAPQNNVSTPTDSPQTTVTVHTVGIAVRKIRESLGHTDSFVKAINKADFLHFLNFTGVITSFFVLGLNMKSVKCGIANAYMISALNNIKKIYSLTTNKKHSKEELEACAGGIPTGITLGCAYLLYHNVFA